MLGTRLLTIWMLGYASLSVTLPARANEPVAAGVLALETRVEHLRKRVSDDGQERVELVPLEDLTPGEEIIFNVSFANVSGDAVHDVRITTPIPPSLIYQEGTAYAPGAAVLYSVDNGLTFAPPEELVISAEQGPDRRARGADYTHVRWILALPLDPGAKGTARFRAMVRDPV